MTLSGNDVTLAEGGGLYNAGTATLSHVTVTNNSATTQGGGVFNSGTLNVTNSILAGNTAGGTGPDLFGALTTSVSNIFGDDSGGSGYDASDRRNIDPMLGALADNGGDLMTHAPQGGSEAIDNADATLAPDVDQRLFVRDDGSPDIGAHEVGASVIPEDLTLHLSTDGDVTGGGQPGTDTWDGEDLVAIDDPELNLGPGTTSGTFSVPYVLDAFAPNLRTNAAHLVTANIMTGGFQLRAGDLLLSAKNAGTYTSNNVNPLDPASARPSASPTMIWSCSARIPSPITRLAPSGC